MRLAIRFLLKSVFDNACVSGASSDWRAVLYGVNVCPRGRPQVTTAVLQNVQYSRDKDATPWRPSNTWGHAFFAD